VLNKKDLLKYLRQADLNDQELELLARCVAYHRKRKEAERFPPLTNIRVLFDIIGSGLMTGDVGVVKSISHNNDLLVTVLGKEYIVRCESVERIENDSISD